MGCTSQQDIFIINFDTLGGSLIESFEVSSYKDFNLPIPEKEGYEFLGWSSSIDGEIIENLADLELIQELTLYANWLLINQELFSIEFYIDGVLYTELEFLYLETIFVPNVNENDYQIFDGWYKDETYTIKFTDEIMPNEDIKLYGRYIKSSYLDDNLIIFFITYNDDSEIHINLNITGNVNFVGFSGFINYDDTVLELISVETFIPIIVNESKSNFIYLSYVDVNDVITSETKVLTMIFKKLEYNSTIIEFTIDKMISIDETYNVFEVEYEIINLEIIN